MATSPPSAACKTGTGFTGFADLPPELRQLVWEFYESPRYQDMKIGSYVDSLNDKFAHNKILRVQPPKLLHICHDSRAFALTRGKIVRASGEGADKGGLSWVDDTVRTVYMSADAAALARLRSLQLNIHSLATLWPTGADLRAFRAFLLERINQYASSPVEVVYVVLSAIIYDGNSSNSVELNNPSRDPNSDTGRFLYDDSDLAVVGIDDPRLPTLLQSAFDASSNKQPPVLFHRSPLCFLNNLRQHWEFGSQSRQLRADWDAAAATVSQQSSETDTATSAPTSEHQPHQSQFPKLKAAVAFGRTHNSLFFGISENTRPHERASGLLFSKTDFHPTTRQPWFAHVDPQFMCRTICRRLPPWNQDGVIPQNRPAY